MKTTCGITIPTHNRQADLERTALALARLTPPPDGVWLCADGCTDGTAQWIEKTHPDFKLVVHPDSRGSIAARDEMMRAASSEVMLSLDDDSYPLEPDAIARVCALFEENPHLGIATFPQRTNECPETLRQADFGPAHFVGTFSNAGTAIRRSTFLAVGGYPLHFRHAYEEPDLALRCVAAGWEVKFEPGVTIRHHYSGVQRSEMRTHHFHARNEFWSVLMRCPAPHFLVVALFRLARQFGYARSRGWRWLVREPVWWGQALRGLPRALATRAEIPWPRYRAWMELVRRPIFSQDEWERNFGRKDH